MFDTSPTLYTPIDGDNGPGLRALIEAGKRWIQINGATCPLKTRVDLLDGGAPADYLLIEPSAGFAKVTIDVTGIGRNSAVPTDPSYAGFEYNGNFRPAGFLAAAAAAGSRTIVVNDGSLYPDGSWIFLSDASTNPSAYLLPLDGPMERRQVVARAGNTLTLEQPLRRNHAANVIAALCTPIIAPTFRDIEFTGNASVGIHIHCATRASIKRITSTAWRGRTLVLLDNAGIANYAEDVFCTGTEAGGGAAQNAWGFAAEGQEDSRFVRCGGTACGNGLMLNYTVDTIAEDALAYACNANVAINFQSTRTVVLSPRTTLPIALDTYISPDSVGCAIIGRIEYVVPANPESAYLDPRTLPVDGLATTDRILAFDENGAGKQIPKNRLLALEADGSIDGEALEIKSKSNAGGSIRVTNAGHSWLVGMLSVAGAKDLTFYDLTSGAVRFSISATSGEFDVPGSMIVHGNMAMEKTSGVYIGGKKVVSEQRPALADLAPDAPIETIRATINKILADERAFGLRAA